MENNTLGELSELVWRGANHKTRTPYSLVLSPGKHHLFDLGDHGLTLFEIMMGWKKPLSGHFTLRAHPSLYFVKMEWPSYWRAGDLFEIGNGVLSHEDQARLREWGISEDLRLDRLSLGQSSVVGTLWTISADTNLKLLFEPFVGLSRFEALKLNSLIANSGEKGNCILICGASEP